MSLNPRDRELPGTEWAQLAGLLGSAESRVEEIRAAASKTALERHRELQRELIQAGIARRVGSGWAVQGSSNPLVARSAATQAKVADPAATLAPSWAAKPHASPPARRLRLLNSRWTATRIRTAPSTANTPV